MIRLDLSFCHQRIIILRSQGARRAKIHQYLVLRYKRLQSRLCSLTFAFSIPPELEEHNRLDKIPKAGNYKTHFVMQETFHSGGLFPTGHHHIPKASEQGVGEMRAEDPLRDEPT